MPIPAPDAARRSFEVTTPLPASPSPENAPIGCVGCGYDLTGLDRSERCPECGRAAADSWHASSLLRHANPRWAHRVGRGLRLLYAGVALMLVAGLLEILRWWIIDQPAPRSPTLEGVELARRIAQPLSAALATGLYAYGCWLSGAHEPRAGARGERFGNALRTTGMLAVPAIAAWALLARGSIALIPASAVPMALGALLLVIWAHLVLVARAARRLAARCAPTGRSARVRGPRIPVVAPVIAGILLIAAGMSRLGIRSPIPMHPSALEHLGWIVLAISWVSLMSALVPTIRGIDAELGEMDRSAPST
ncbi:MAG: hypothetical protein ACTS3F_14195 [Phycisphaerales bacterium]